MDTPPAISQDEASRIVAQIGIPPCPAVLTAMLKEARKDDPDMMAVRDLIASDVGISAALLKTVNSPFYGLVNKVTSIQHAIAYLGINSAVRLVTGLMLQQAFSVDRNAVISRVWDESARTAAGTAQLAGELGVIDRDEAYTFGLFRDCGMLLMARRFTGYDQLLGPSGEPHDACLSQAEGDLYGADHAEVGYRMARSWYLPESLAQAVHHHHDIAFVLDRHDAAARDSRVLVALGLLADRSAIAVDGGAVEANWNHFTVASLACLGVTVRQLPYLLALVREAQEAGDE